MTGCAFGEVLGLAISSAQGWSAAPSIALAVVLAFVFGYAFTMLPLVRSGMTLLAATGAALAADTASIAVMEIVDNAVMLAIPGAMQAGLGSLHFWASLAFSLVVAWFAAFPVNRWLLARGLGHGRHGGH